MHTVWDNSCPEIINRQTSLLVKWKQFEIFIHTSHESLERFLTGVDENYVDIR